jgi:hypothetical protein
MAQPSRTPIKQIISNISRQPRQSFPVKRREGYTYIDSTNPNTWLPPAIERQAPFDKHPLEVTPNGNIYPDQPVSMSETPYKQQLPTAQQRLEYALQTKSVGGNCTPITDQLIPETSSMVYTDEFFQQPEARLFLNNVQPNIYSYNVDLTPINANIGISYTPQIPPKFRDQVYNLAENATYPLYTRIDPQLIRKDGVPARLAEQPIRNEWSGEYSSFNPPPGSVDWTDVYDPRFTSYGDGTRAYQDVNLGQTQYYYSDVDAYRYPNYVSRSKVDFIEYTTPMGTVKPYYVRQAGLDDVRPYVANQWMNDTNYFRENLSEEQSRKMNARTWQLRYAPQSKANHAHYLTQGY